MLEIHKYPRTRHLEGSKLQPGDSDLDQVPLDELRGAYCVIEEKLDGANAGISRDPAARAPRVRLQSRGHVLVGGPREKHWDLFKRWAGAHTSTLLRLLADGMTIYGEWLYAKHTIFYDQLPHYFFEFDIRDAAGDFWSTARRRAHLADVPVVSVPILWEGVVADPRKLPELVRDSLYKSPRWRDRLRDAARESRIDPDQAARETDPRDTAEGLYIKVEDRDRGTVVARYKWVRASFIATIADQQDHWLARPILPNQLADGVDLFAP